MRVKVLNYLKHYDLLIAKAQERDWCKKTAPVYTEVHHVVPVCMGGTNDKTNLVTLSAREHFVAHWLLSNAYRCDLSHPLHKAFLAMTYNRYKKRYVNSRGWAIARERFAKSQTGVPLSGDHLEAVRAAGKRRRGKPGVNKGKSFGETARHNMAKAAIKNSPALNLACLIGTSDKLVTVPCLFSFCQENNLNCSNALKVYRGLRKTIKGFKIFPV